MDLKLLLTVMFTVFMAELGDKTQLAILGFSAANKSWISVFLGGFLGLIFATSVAVLVGTVFRKFIPVEYLRMIGAFIFVGIGVWMFFKQ